MGRKVQDHDSKLTWMAGQMTEKEKAIEELRGQLYQERLSRVGGDGQAQNRHDGPGERDHEDQGPRGG